ncbi:hypothetical protein COV81_02405 [Candidatus Peregrinibacteria bacterium CG11_big_fil_rev_8_21_14_0_20_41_10]|nr:MAG: hypothetical protein COV81_02405 [Candidatus Peregrinibacteria bacterium CG11_big_fil_rev_8_21_14_0_20_41_10]
MKNKKIIISLITVGIILIAVPIVIKGIEAYQLKQLMPSDVYIVSGEIRENTGETFSGIVQKRKDGQDGKIEPSFSYDLNPSIGLPNFAPDHPFRGYNCGTIDFGVSVENDTLTINEMQKKLCDQKQLYYITNLINESRDFSQIRINQLVDGKLINFYEYTIPERQELGE